MMDIIRMDRKQVFGTEEIDEDYMYKIRMLLDQRIHQLTMKAHDNSVTLPLTRWV